MPICLVIDNKTGETINRIVAEPTDPAPYGCRLEVDSGQVLLSVIEEQVETHAGNISE